MSEEAKSDRRRAPRLQGLNLVNAAQFDEKGFYADLAVGRTLDISQRGIRLELSHALPLRSTVSLSVALGSELVELKGTVAHLEAIEEGRCSMGIEFTELGPDARAAIDRYLGERGGSASGER
jgi:PilZ domain-containing protein